MSGDTNLKFGNLKIKVSGRRPEVIWTVAPEAAQAIRNLLGLCKRKAITKGELERAVLKVMEGYTDAEALTSLCSA